MTCQQLFLWKNTRFYVHLSTVDVDSKEERCSKYVEKYLIFKGWNVDESSYEPSSSTIFKLVESRYFKSLNYSEQQVMM